MLKYTDLQVKSPIAILGDGCDATTAAIQKVSSTKQQVSLHLRDHCTLITAMCNQVLVGWGASTPELYKASYFVSTTDSVRQYIDGFLHLAASLGLTYISIVTGLSNGDDSYVSDSFRQMASSANQVYYVRSVLRLSTHCDSACQLMPSGEDPSTLGASASRAVLLIASEAYTQQVVRTYALLVPLQMIKIDQPALVIGQYTTQDRRAEGLPLDDSQCLFRHSGNNIKLIRLDFSCAHH